MKITLLLLLAVTWADFAQSLQTPLQDNKINAHDTVIHDVISGVTDKYGHPATSMKPLYINQMKEMLHTEGISLKLANKVLTALTCAKKYNADHNNILTIIDYSLPSNERRLWVFDLNTKTLLFHTFVAHGIRSGYLLSDYFSNIHNSKASSIGVYNTEKSYYGRHGLSLRLDGLERSFNDNASNRAIVMHGAWYVEEGFIKKYGRAGRSWGCPAVPKNLTRLIINTIKDESLFVAYYPSDDWLIKSKFLNCNNPSPILTADLKDSAVKPAIDPSMPQEPILFVYSNQKQREMIAVITADNYERLFHLKPPLTRMLRRQIENVEYIALSDKELSQMLNPNAQPDGEESLNTIHFVYPEVKNVRGYYATELKFSHWGKIKEVKANPTTATDDEITGRYTVYFEGNNPVNLKARKQFIRWVGL